MKDGIVLANQLLDAPCPDEAREGGVQMTLLELEVGTEQRIGPTKDRPHLRDVAV